MSSPTRRDLSIEELKVIVAPIAKEYGVGKVYLFGSRARGDHREGSDYDFCIELGKIRSISVLSGLFQDLREAIGYDIDLVDISSIDPKFIKNIMDEGVVAYG